MNRLLILALLFALISCEAQKSGDQTAENAGLVQIQAKTPSLELNDNINLGIPQSKENHSEIIISRKQYVISWNQFTRNPNWAAWKLEASNLGKSQRSNFKTDPDLKNYLIENNGGFAVNTSDYSGSCFNRGHIVPSADRNATPDDNRVTFYMSNMTPQTAFLNQTAWGHLEDYERELAKEGKTLYIYSGPIYGAERGGIGAYQDIKIPSKIFKIIVIVDPKKDNLTIQKDSMIIVIMPNKTSAGTWPDEDKKTLCDDSKRLPPGHGDFNDWKQFQTTLDEVEAESGFHFFDENETPVLSPVILAS